MFLDWVSHIGLLQHDIETNIIGEFALSVKRIIASQIASFLVEGANFKLLRSRSHVLWVMEAIGQGFTLPIEEEETIVKVIALYSRWAMDGNGRRPKPIDDDPQFFIQKILGHFSLIFEPKPSGPEKHAILCSKVLDIYLQIARVIGPKLSNATWQHLIKLLVGIADSVLKSDNQNPHQEVLQKKLSTQIAKTLFEIWFHSQTRNIELWEALTLRASGWMNHLPVITTWSFVCQSLTKRTLTVLYDTGNNESGTDGISLQMDDQLLSIPVDNEFLFYSWHKMLRLFPNPNQISNPGIYLEFMNAIDFQVNLYLNVKISSHSKLLPPSGNTILHIFGKWLFESVHLDRNGFEDGTARAIKTLCNIMVSKHNTDFLPVYYGAFFGGLQACLMKEGKVLYAVLSSTNLFTIEMKGMRALVPSYAAAIYKVLTKKTKMMDNFVPEKLRKECLTLLGTLICLPNHFGRTAFTLRINDPKIRPFDVQNYQELSPHFSRILIEALSIEDYPPNIEHLLNLIFVYQCEDLKYSSEFTKQSLSLINRKTAPGGGWSLEVSCMGIKSLSSMSNLYSRIDKAYEVANRIVVNLCNLILSFPIQSVDKIIEEVIIYAYKCIIDWIIPEQWILNHSEARNLLFKTFVYGIVGTETKVEKKQVEQQADPKKKEKKKDNKFATLTTHLVSSSSSSSSSSSPIRFSERIREAARNALTTLMNQFGNFPSSMGPSITSTLAREEDILAYHNDPERSKEYLRYFMTSEKTLITVIDRPDSPSGPSVSIIIRDKSGKYAWDSHLTFLPLRPKDRNLPPPGLNAPIPVCVDPAPLPPVINASKVDKVMQYISQSDSRAAQQVVSQYIDKENQFLRSNYYHLNLPISIRPSEPMDPYVTDCKFQQSRMLLSHLGVLSVESWGLYYPITMNEAFYQSLRDLDNVKERECIKVGVVYIQRGQMEEDTFRNTGGSMDYQEFISSLGWGVALNKHQGYTGTLDTQTFKGGVVAPYWSNYTTEILFHVSTLMTDPHGGNSEAQVNYRQNQVINSHVVVCWNENLTTYQPQFFCGRGRHNLIINIFPMECGLYHLKLYSKSDLRVGPAIDNLVVSKDILGYIIRETAISNYRREVADERISSQIRQSMLDSISQQFRKDNTLEQFFTQLFTSLPSEQLSPLQVKASIPITPILPPSFPAQSPPQPSQPWSSSPSFPPVTSSKSPSRPAPSPRSDLHTSSPRDYSPPQPTNLAINNNNNNNNSGSADFGGNNNASFNTATPAYNSNNNNNVNNVMSGSNNITSSISNLSNQSPPPSGGSSPTSPAPHKPSGGPPRRPAPPSRNSGNAPPPNIPGPQSPVVAVNSSPNLSSVSGGEKRDWLGTYRGPMRGARQGSDTNLTSTHRRSDSSDEVAPNKPHKPMPQRPPPQPFLGNNNAPPEMLNQPAPPSQPSPSQPPGVASRLPRPPPRRGLPPSGTAQSLPRNFQPPNN